MCPLLVHSVVLTLEWLATPPSGQAPLHHVLDPYVCVILSWGVISTFSGFPGIEIRKQLRSASEMASGAQLGDGRWLGRQEVAGEDRQSLATVPMSCTLLTPSPKSSPSVLCSVMLSRRSAAPFLRFPPQRTSSVLPVRGSGRELEGQQRGKRPSSCSSFCRHLCIYSGNYTAVLLTAHAPAMGHHTPSLNGVQASFRGPSVNCVSPSVV